MNAVVFDVGGVLVKEKDRFGALSLTFRSIGVDVDARALESAYWVHRDAYDLGMSDAEYWEKTLLMAGLDPAVVGKADMSALGKADGAQNAAVRPEVEELLRSLFKAGVPLAILSNAPVSMSHAVKASACADLFAEMVFSNEINAAKPSAAAYEAVEKRLGRAPNNLIFFDDRPINVETARARGWNAHVWQGEQAAEHLLRSLDVL